MVNSLPRNVLKTLAIMSISPMLKNHKKQNLAPSLGIYHEILIFICCSFLSFYAN
jgi:hypothetical protein